MIVDGLLCRDYLVVWDSDTISRDGFYRRIKDADVAQKSIDFDLMCWFFELLKSFIYFC